MQSIVLCVLILGFVSPCLCLEWNFGTNDTFYDVMDYGAIGDGQSDDSQDGILELGTKGTYYIYDVMDYGSNNGNGQPANQIHNYAFLRAWESTCGEEGITTLVIPPNKVFMVKSLLLNGPCNASSIHIQLLGQIVAPPKDKWVGVRSKWIMITYVNGLTIDGGGVINGYGSTWWHKCRGRHCHRPTALHFHYCNDLTVRYLNITNSPRTHISINDCEGVKFSNISIQAPYDSPNTDGFDIAASKNISIEDSNIGTGDDCIAINGGSSYINVTRVACGPGHGISIGSLGKNRTHEAVEEIYVRNCSFVGTQNGARIKTWPGGSGYARKITFEQIELIGAGNPIFIDQHYSSINSIDAAVQVSEVTYRDFRGTSADDKAISFDCWLSGCFNLVLDQINIVSSEPGKETYSFCKNAHGIVGSTTPNVSCLLE